MFALTREGKAPRREVLSKRVEFNAEEQMRSNPAPFVERHTYSAGRRKKAPAKFGRSHLCIQNPARLLKYMATSGCPGPSAFSPLSRTTVPRRLHALNHEGRAGWEMLVFFEECVRRRNEFTTTAGGVVQDVFLRNHPFLPPCIFHVLQGLVSQGGE